MNIQQTIQQLGGHGKLKAMIGARNFSRAGKNSMSFEFKGSRKANIVKIVLTPSDEYELTFFKFSNKSGECKEIDTVPAWCGNIQEVFEDFTGLYLSP